jgi:2-polyprenyl-3-methyl-5-hydroxy-6-metoxy-1,4-benzoquinol methylase
MKRAYFRRLITELRPLPGTHILEVGSGDGLFSLSMAKWCPETQVTGIDYDTDHARACEQVRKIMGPRNLRFIPADVNNPPDIPPQDVVCCLDVLEHLDDDKAALETIRALMKPLGCLIVHVPNRNYMGLDGGTRTGADSQAYLSHPGHVRSGYTPDELRDVVEDAGFAVDRVEQWHGPLTHLAYSIEGSLLRRRFGRVMRLFAIPAVSLIVRFDMTVPKLHGNTVLLIARRP